MKREPPMPGDILRKLMAEKGLTQTQLAQKMGVAIQTVNLIINGKREVTAQTALRLAKALDTTPEFWMSAQVAVSIARAKRELQAEGRI